MRVVALWRYPVKSIGGEQLEHVEVSDLGFTGDRHWGVRDLTTGKVLTARREPKLLFASARLGADGALDLQLPDGHSSLSDWLGHDVELVEATPEVRGQFENPLDFENDDDWMEWTGPEGVFHDSKRTRVSLLSLASIGAWDPRGFRANVIVDLGPEDDLVGRSVRLGSAVLAFTKRVDRCVMVTRPQPGLDRDLDVLRVINQERSGNLAVGATVATPGTIRVGDEVELVG
jgi:uncharacterized protein YcbX